MLRSLRILGVFVVVCALVSLLSGTSNAGTIIKLSLGSAPRISPLVASPCRPWTPRSLPLPAIKTRLLISKIFSVERPTSCCPTHRSA